MLYSMDADGSDQTRLTNDAEVDLLPSWSPDGDTSVFDTFRDESFEVYALDADGEQRDASHQQRSESTIRRRVAPDGSKIPSRTRRNGPDDGDLRDGAEASTRRASQHRSMTSHPTWSPDGPARSPSCANRDGNHEIYVMDADGTDQTRLTNYSAGN